MNQRKCEDCYFGYYIDGMYVPSTRIGCSTWHFIVRREDQDVFKLEMSMTRSLLAGRGLEKEQAEEEVRCEGLRRVRGRLSLGWFDSGEDYKHIIREDGEQVTPPLPKQHLMFDSDEERITYYLLYAWNHIRTEFPSSFTRSSLDWKGICNLTQTPSAVGIKRLRMLGEDGFIEGLHFESDEKGSWEPHGRTYINTRGIAYYERLESKILKRMEAVMAPDVIGNAVLILRCLRELGAVGISRVTSQEALNTSGLSEEHYKQADAFLRGQKYVESTLGELTGKRAINPAGLKFLEEQMSNRIRLSLNAERIARLLFNERDYRAHGEKIQEALGLDAKKYEEAVYELVDEEIVEDTLKVEGVRFFEIGLTSEGRKAVRNNFVRMETPTLQQNIGAIFQGPVSSSNVLAVAQAYQSRVQQEIENGNVEALRVEVAQLVDDIVKAMKEELDTDQLAVYAEAAKELKQEAAKSNPNPSIIQKCLGILSFAGDLDGTLELAGKAISLSAKVSPYILLLGQAVATLLQNLPGS